MSSTPSLSSNVRKTCLRLAPFTCVGSGLRGIIGVSRNRPFLVRRCIDVNYRQPVTDLMYGPRPLHKYFKILIQTLPN